MKGERSPRRLPRIDGKGRRVILIEAAEVRGGLTVSQA